MYVVVHQLTDWGRSYLFNKLDVTIEGNTKVLFTNLLFNRVSNTVRVEQLVLSVKS